jgi:hypothetical protein
MDDPTHYPDLGLVNTREMFKKAMEGGYAVWLLQNTAIEAAQHRQ